MNESGIEEVERRTIALRDDTPLPCALLRDGGVCGRPATVAQAWPVTLPGLWPTLGLWAVQPVCQECLAEVVKLYGAES